MQHFRFDNPSSYLTPLPLFCPVATIDDNLTQPSQVTYERVHNTHQHNYAYNTTSNGSRNFMRLATGPNSGSQSARAASPLSHRSIECTTFGNSTLAPLQDAHLRRQPARSTAIYRQSSRPVTTSLNHSAFQPVPKPSRLRGTRTYTTAHFQGLFGHRGRDPLMVISGRPAVLEKLRRAQTHGMYIQAHPFASAALAFEYSLRPFQLSEDFPSTWQMESLFAAPRHEQLASGLDKDRDFSISLSDSAVDQVSPALKAVREIDCARSFLEIGGRHLGSGSVFSIIVITWGMHADSLAHEITTISGKSATHSIVMFREMKSLASHDYSETWHSSVFTTGVPAAPIPPLSPTARLEVCASTMTPEAKTNPVTGRWCNRDSFEEEDVLASITDEKDVDGEVILRAAQLYTNTELHEKIKALGSTASYNSVTKRITNSLKVRTRASLLPGQVFTQKYNAQRATFNAERKKNLAAARKSGRISTYSTARSFQSTTSYSEDRQYHRSDFENPAMYRESEDVDASDTDMEDPRDGGVINQAESYGKDSLSRSADVDALRRFTRRVRNSTKLAVKDEIHEWRNGAGKDELNEQEETEGEPDEQQSDDSDVSEWEDA
ncbi:hypothetical protein Slin14017_G116480 [Septoria linicola]|nr:hypothetical protein Slin14017_G116480 [Septoria linicola]